MSLIYIFFGFIGGFICDVNFNGVNFWLSQLKISRIGLGIVCSSCIPYAFSSMFYVLVARMRENKRVGKYFSFKSLTLVCQIILGLLVILIGQVNPKKTLVSIFIICFFISLFHTIEDSLFANFRTSIPLARQDAASGLYVIGYKIGTAFSGLLCMGFIDVISWKKIFSMLGIVILIFPIFLLCSFKNKEISSYVRVSDTKQEPKNFFQGLMRIELKVLLGLILISLFFRSTYNMVVPMLNVFFLEHGFLAKQIMLYGKWIGALGSILGSFLGYKILCKFSIKTVMHITLLLSGLSHIFLIFPQSRNIYWLICITVVTSITSGINTCVYTTFITRMSSHLKLGILYPLCQSIANISRALLPIVSGLLIYYLGWNKFFCISIGISLICLLVIKIRFV